MVLWHRIWDDPPRSMNVCVEVRTSSCGPDVLSITARPDGTIRWLAYCLMNSHSSGVRKSESTSTMGRSEAVVRVTCFCPCTDGTATVMLWPILTPGQMNCPPVYR